MSNAPAIALNKWKGKLGMDGLLKFYFLNRTATYSAPLSSCFRLLGSEKFRSANFTKMMQ